MRRPFKYVLDLEALYGVEVLLQVGVGGLAHTQQ